MHYIIDTREKNALNFRLGSDNAIEIKKLNIGDYSLKGYENKIAIERKSPGDLFGTLGGGNKRFKKELLKALEYEYFAIIIEGSYDKILNKEFEGSYHCQMRGYVITSILFTLHVKYGINVFFCNDRRQSVKIINEIFKAYLKLKNGTKKSTKK